MHEYSLVQAMFDQIGAAAVANGAIAVRRVRVRIGQLAGVEPALLQTAYDLFRVRTICADAPLEIAEVVPRWNCPAGHGDIPADRPLTCPSCGAAARLAAGDEIILDQLELEVP
jgi:hydrogenase nickel incorporation protein HypA/HybF